LEKLTPDIEALRFYEKLASPSTSTEAHPR
jgi:hypothetical protein